MATSICQTLIRAASVANPSHFSATAKPNLLFLRRSLSGLADGSFSVVELTPTEAEAKAVKKLEDFIYAIIIEKSRPDWLPFVPGASYWVPPRRHSYGVAKIVNQFSNALTEEEFNALTTLQGWPCSAFYLSHDATSHSTEGLTASKSASSTKEE